MRAQNARLDRGGLLLRGLEQSVLRLGSNLPKPLGGLLEGRIELGRLPVVGNGAVLVASFETRIAAVVVGRCIVRIEFYRHIVVANGMLFVLQLLPALPALLLASAIVPFPPALPR